MADDRRSPAEAVTIIVAVVDRDIRRAWSEVLLEAGYLVRAVTRPAELAKAQADGTARLIVRTAHEDDAKLTMSASLPTLMLPATLPVAELPTHIHKALAKGER